MLCSQYGRTSIIILLNIATLPAASISGIQLINNSTPSFVLEDSIRAREFQTQGALPSVGTPVGSDIFFTSRFAWMSAQRVFPGPSDLPLTHGNRVAYDLTFTVEDPALRGYTLTVDSTIRGYVTAFWEDNVGVFPSFVFAAGTLMGASLDDGNGFGPLLPDISTDTEVATATEAEPFANELVARSGSHQTGQYVGTRTFTLRYSNVAGNTSAALQNFNIGEANVRFGLNPTYGGFINAAYPGIDGETAEMHGHFVTVGAHFEDSLNSVPEPATVGMFALGSLAMIAAKVRSKR